jgi:RecB family exonuclease
VLKELGERTVWSASSLEAWVGCPVRWLVERLLGLEGLDGEREPLARGALAHAALRQVFERLRESRGSARLTPPRVAEAKRLLTQALDEHAGMLSGLAPEQAPAVRRGLQADLERYLEYAADAESPLEPSRFELEFDGLDLGEGVSVRGRIDRVDEGPGGQAVVYDYKGRSATPGSKWVGEGALQVALYMTAVERLLGAEPIGGFYQPLAGRDLRARGVLDADAAVALDVVRTDRMDREETARIVGACRDVALAAVGEARAGALQPRPSTCGYDGGCMYPEICRCG